MMMMFRVSTDRIGTSLARSLLFCRRSSCIHRASSTRADAEERDGISKAQVRHACLALIYVAPCPHGRHGPQAKASSRLHRFYTSDPMSTASFSIDGEEGRHAIKCARGVMLPLSLRELRYLNNADLSGSQRQTRWRFATAREARSAASSQRSTRGRGRHG